MFAGEIFDVSTRRKQDGALRVSLVDSMPMSQIVETFALDAIDRRSKLHVLT